MLLKKLLLRLLNTRKVVSSFRQTTNTDKWLSSYFKKKIKLAVVPPGAMAVTIILLFFSALQLLRLSALPPNRPVIYLGFPLSGFTVVVDPGHGGIDPGTHYNGLSLITEKEIVLAVGLELAGLLRQAGARVVMTRTTDEGAGNIIPPGSDTPDRRDLKGRVKLINESGAHLFVSIHVNYCDDPGIRGAIAFYSEKFPENKLLAEAIHKHINPVVVTNPQEREYFHQQPKVNGYYILNYSNIPGVILEIAFISSPSDRQLLMQDSYRNQIARAIFMGLVEYLHLKP